jgi:hypothetical protein
MVAISEAMAEPAAAGENDGGDQRTHLAGHGDGDEVRHIDRGAELAQLGGGLQGQDKADEKGDERDDGKGVS